MKSSLFQKGIILRATFDSFRKLHPQTQLKNPVIFITLLGAILTTAILFTEFNSFNFQITIWLWFTVLFANFS